MINNVCMNKAMGISQLNDIWVGALFAMDILFKRVSLAFPF